MWDIFLLIKDSDNFILQPAIDKLLFPKAKSDIMFNCSMSPSQGEECLRKEMARFPLNQNNPPNLPSNMSPQHCCPSISPEIGSISPSISRKISPRISPSISPSSSLSIAKYHQHVPSRLMSKSPGRGMIQ